MAWLRSIASSTLNEFNQALANDDIDSDEEEDDDDLSPRTPKKRKSRPPTPSGPSPGNCSFDDSEVAVIKTSEPLSDATQISVVESTVGQETATLINGDEFKEDTSLMSSAELVQNLTAEIQGKSVAKEQSVGGAASTSPATLAAFAMDKDDTLNQRQTPEPGLPSIDEAVESGREGQADKSLCSAAVEEVMNVVVKEEEPMEGPIDFEALIRAMEPETAHKGDAASTLSQSERAAKLIRRAREAKKSWRALDNGAFCSSHFSLPELAGRAQVRCQEGKTGGSETRENGQAVVGDESQRILRSFSERYDKLLEQYRALQGRCRELSAREQELQRVADTWKAEVASSQARLAKSAMDVAELSEARNSSGGSHLRSLEADVEKLRAQLRARDDELAQASDALRQLQDVVEDDGRSQELETLRARAAVAERKAEDAQIALREERLKWEKWERQRQAEEAAKARDAPRREESYDELKIEVDDLRMTLTTLLDAKEKDLAEREHLVDGKLVRQMLENYLAHMKIGSRKSHELQQQILEQMLSILGSKGEEDSERARLIAEAREKIERRPIAPIGDAFTEFLEKDL